MHLASKRQRVSPLALVPTGLCTLDEPFRLWQLWSGPAWWDSGSKIMPVWWSRKVLRFHDSKNSIWCPVKESYGKLLKEIEAISLSQERIHMIDKVVAVHKNKEQATPVYVAKCTILCSNTWNNGSYISFNCQTTIAARSTKTSSRRWLDIFQLTMVTNLSTCNILWIAGCYIAIWFSMQPEDSRQRKKLQLVPKAHLKSLNSLPVSRLHIFPG